MFVDKLESKKLFQFWNSFFVGKRNGAKTFG